MMPDGTVIQDVPEGTTKADLMARLGRTNVASPPSAGPSGNPTSQYVAGAAGASNGITAGLTDRIASAMGAVVPNPAGTSIFQGPNGMRSFPDAYSLTNQQVRGYQSDLRKDNPGTSSLSELGGSIVSPLNRIFPGAGMLPRIANNAAYGTIFGAATGDNPGMDALKGGASGVASGEAFRLLGKAVSPTLTPAVAKLKQLGVTLTPGQAIGGWAKSLEDKLTSFPGLGDLINSSRRAGISQLNRGVINEALAPIGQALPKTLQAGRDAIDWAHQAVSSAYDKALSGMSVQPDEPFFSGLSDVMGGAHLASDQTADLQRVIAKHVTPYVNDVMDGQAIQKVKIGLDQQISRYAKGAPRDQDIADVLSGVRDQFMGLASRAEGAAGDLFRRANQAFANMVPVAKAGAKVIEDGPFSPGNLSTAVREADRSVRKNAYARGAANMQATSDAASAVLPSKYPDSGTVGRALLAAAASGGAGTAAALGHPVALGAGTFAAWPYVPGGRQAADWLFTGRQGPVAKTAGKAVGLLAGPAANAVPLLLLGK